MICFLKNFIYEILRKISHFVRNDNQCFMLGDEDVIICHSERSEESTILYRTTIICFLKVEY